MSPERLSYLVGVRSLPEPGDITQIAVISGKGGTGKTSLTGAFASLAGCSVIADCDVDAADLALILKAKTRLSGEFSGSRKARIDSSKCVACGRCADVCRAGAIRHDTAYEVAELDCEGCGVCKYVCTAEAINMKNAVSGHWYVSDTPYGTLVHAKLEPGEENSGKLVTLVRNKATEIASSQGLDLVLIDGPPGIGCPVISTLSGVSMALVVTEPTLSAIHDMERVLAVCAHFGVPAAVCVNRFDLCEENCRLIEESTRSLGVKLLGKIPYDTDVVSAMVKGRTVVEVSKGKASHAIRSLWEDVRALAFSHQSKWR